MQPTNAVLSRKGRDRDEAHRLVRRFSKHVGDNYPQQDLAQALSVTEEYEQTREQSQVEEWPLDAFLPPNESKSRWVMKS